MVIFMLLSTFFEATYYYYLKKKYNSLWISLGSPEMFRNYSSIIKDKINDFEIKKTYLTFNNKFLEWFVIVKNYSNKFFYLFLVLYMLIIFLNVLQGNFKKLF